MTSLPVALAAYLAEQGHGAWSTTSAYTPEATAIFVGDMQTAPDRAVCLSGYPTSAVQGSSNQPEVTARLRIRTRAPAEPDSWAMCTAISDLLDGHPRVELAGGLVVCNSVIQQVDPLDQGVDQNNRHLHSTVVQVEYLRPSRTR